MVYCRHHQVYMASREICIHTVHVGELAVVHALGIEYELEHGPCSPSDTSTTLEIYIDCLGLGNRPLAQQHISII